MSDVKKTILFKKALGCLIGGLIGDSLGTPSEGMDYRAIDKQFGWIDDFSSDGTDDTVMKNLLVEALINSNGNADMDDWAEVWLKRWNEIFGDKQSKFFPSVLHTAHKLKQLDVPRMAALGNMPSSSSAMCISPVGIVNACNPRNAATQSYNLGSLIHIHDVGFCQDGAAVIAAAVAEAFKPETDVKSIIDAAINYIMKRSGKELLDSIENMLRVAKEAKEYKTFRKAIYDQSEKYFKPITCDSRETVPITIALFYLSEGDVEKSITYGANFGRDADTIASMCGAIAGAYKGIEGIKGEWVAKAKKYSKIDQEETAENLCITALKKADMTQKAIISLNGISSG